MWAVITQNHWDKDFTIIPKVQTVRNWLGDAVAVIDATHPMDISDFPERNKIPEDVISKIKGKPEIFRQLV